MSKVDWQKVVKENKPKLSLSTIRTYASTLKGIIQHMGATDSKEDFFETHHKQVMAHLKELEYGTRKNCLSSAMATTKNEQVLEIYRTQMLKDIKTYNDKQKDQTMDAGQKKNWMSQAEVRELYNKLDAEVAHLWAKKVLKQGDLRKLMGFVALSCYVLIPPRRILDYTAFKVRGVNKEEDNYMEGKRFIFNKYKTVKAYGTQKVTIPEKLRVIVTKWKAKHDNDYLLFDTHDKPMTQNKLTLLLNKVFGKKVSANALRHIFISDEVLKDMPALKKLEKTAQDMAHSTAQQMLYKKIDPNK